MDHKSLFKTIKIVVVSNREKDVLTMKNIVGTQFAWEWISDIDCSVSYLMENINTTALVMVSLDYEENKSVDLINRIVKTKHIWTLPVIAISEKEPAPEIIGEVLDLGVADFFEIDGYSELKARHLQNAVSAYMRGKLREIRRTETDSLTGALNMKGLRSRFEELKEIYSDRYYIFVYSDIVNFKYFNSVFGYNEGNKLLCFWCDAIRKYSGPDDLICRVSADQVIIVIPVVKGEETTPHFNDILAEVRERFGNNFGDYTINIVAGAYFYDPASDRNETLDEVIGFAKQAQKSIKAKNNTSGCVDFSNEMWDKERRRIELNGHLDTAIKRGEIYLNIQPQYNCVTGELIGGEVLCRWTHTKYGFISPADFIPALEQSGKIFELDLHIWQETCKLLKKWQDRGIRLPLSVNVSRKDIEYAYLPGVFSELAETYEIDPSLLNIEITESAFMEGVGELVDIISEFSERGFTVEMDDFGSGFSSLNMLSDLNVDILKMDMGFLREKADSLRSGNIINAVVKMAHVLGINVLAEGVETPEQVDFLKNVGCLMVQGYLFSKPVSVEAFEALLDSTNISNIRQNYSKSQVFNIQDMFDQKSSGFYLFNRCIGAATLFDYDGEKIQPSLVNDEFEKLIGWKRGEIERHRGDVFDDFSESNQQILTHYIMTAKEEGFSEGIIHSERLGKYLHASFRHLANNGNADSFFCEAKDVTDEILLQKKVSELQKEHQSQMEFMPTGTTRCEYKGNRLLIYASDSLVKLYGCQDEEEFFDYYRHYSDLIHPDETDRIIDVISGQLEAGIVAKAEHRIVNRYGRSIWVVQTARVVADENGKNWVYISMTDIDSIKKERQQSRWYEEKYKAVMEIPGMVIYEYDPAKDFMLVSIRGEDGILYEKKANHYLDVLPDQDWVHKEDVVKFSQAIRSVVKDGGYNSVSARALYPKGNYKMVKFHFSAIKDEFGEVLRVIGRAEKG